MEVFIPLIFFWVMSAIIKGLQKEQSASKRGGPLPRPKPRSDGKQPEAELSQPQSRPRSVRRESQQQMDATVPAQDAEKDSRIAAESRVARPQRESRLKKEGEMPQRESRLKKEGEMPQRESRLKKEGEIPRSQSRISQESAARDLIAQQELQVMKSERGGGAKQARSEGASNVLGRIRQDLKHPRSLQAAILYSEILGAPRAYEPHRKK